MCTLKLAQQIIIKMSFYSLQERTVRLTNPKTIASIFEKRPHQWGLRGDPHLLRERFEKLR